MNRRYFIALMSSIIGVVPAGISFASTMSSQNELSKLAFDHAQTSIRGAFGSGFRLISARPNDAELHCTIEHFGNVLEVSSTDLIDWRIDAAPAM
jgi:hypothetical protein